MPGMDRLNQVDVNFTHITTECDRVLARNMCLSYLSFHGIVLRMAKRMQYVHIIQNKMWNASDYVALLVHFSSIFFVQIQVFLNNC